MTMVTRRFQIDFPHNNRTAIWLQFNEQFRGLKSSNLVVHRGLPEEGDWEVRDFTGNDELIDHAAEWFRSHGLTVTEKIVV